MNRMHIYSVHVDPKAKNPLENAVFLREGFSRAAFFLNIFWALYHRLWEAAGLFAVLIGIAVTVADAFTKSGDSHFIIMLGILSAIGLVANDLWQYTLQKRGWIITDLIVASSSLEATQRFYDRHTGRHAAPLFQNAPLAAI